MDTMICLRMGKIYTVKTPPGDFKVTTSENPLLSKQAITNKGITVPYTNLQLNPYPNTQLDLFSSDNLFFQCTAPSMWLTNCADPSMRLDHQLEKDVGCKVLLFITRWRSWSCLVTKLYGVQNTVASSRERRTKANSISGHTLLHTCGIMLLCNLCHLLRPSK